MKKNKVKKPKRENKIGLKVIEGSKDINYQDELLDPKASGGTEILARRVFKELPELCEQFNWVLSYDKVRPDPNKPSILWMHETPFDAGIHQNFKNPEYWQRFVKIIFISYWQQQMFHLMYGVPYERSIVVQNAIDPIMIEKKPSTSVMKLIYASTPHRGLNILLDTLQSDQFSDINWELNVFSSFKLYNRAIQDSEYKPLFDRCNEDNRINYHGAQSNDVVRNFMVDSHILAYPCKYMETSCITAMEAMSAGNIVICPNYGALPETTANFSWSYNWEEDEERHKHIFGHILKDAMKNYNQGNIREMLNVQKVYADTFYSWNARIPLWEQVMNAILGAVKKYEDPQTPTPEAV
tara:strand:- start:36 stop:1094 length:1059 start_codon:yes stop_codon:yes gene_type:complete